MAPLVRRDPAMKGKRLKDFAEGDHYLLCPPPERPKTIDEVHFDLLQKDKGTMHAALVRQFESVAIDRGLYDTGAWWDWLNATATTIGKGLYHAGKGLWDAYWASAHA